MDSARTAQYTLSVWAIKTSQLMLYREIIAVLSQIRTDCTNTLRGRRTWWHWTLKG